MNVTHLAKTGFSTSALARAFLMSVAVLFAMQPFVGLAEHEDRNDTALAMDSRAAATSAGLRAAAAYSEQRKGSAMLVLSGGEVVFESYGKGAGPDEPHRLASGTKSFWGVLAMAAVEDGLLTLDELVADTLTEWRSDRNKSRIQVRHLLDFTSGLDPAERLLRGNPKSENKFKLVLDVPSLDAPGNTFAYGPSHLFAFGVYLQRKLQAAGRPSDPVAYLEQRILDPIGLRVGRWTRDAAGNPIMPSGAFIAPREWLKLGELLNRRGSWNGRQIVATDLISQVFEGSKANPAYGLTVWLNQGGGAARTHPMADDRAAERVANSDDGFIYQAGPRDLTMAAGAGKQRLYVIPSRDLVILRFGESKGVGWSDAEFLTLALSQAESAIPETSMLPGTVDSAPGEWRAACAADIQRYCEGNEGHDRRLRRCLRDHRKALSPECIAAAKAARRDAN